MKIQATIQKWGNSLALRITGPLKTIPHLEANMLVEVEVNEKGFTVQPIVRKKARLVYTEAELLKGLTAEKAHADEIADLHPRELDGRE